ncbi:MAG: hypothetical protein FWE11_01465 [Defluviitaleaceae bacterium]|nr:hypothetical protein [Defluviitaleaceae bacterium]
MKRFAMIFAVLALALMFVAACNRGGNNDVARGDVPTPPTGEPNQWGWIVPEETLVIDLYTGWGDHATYLEDDRGGRAFLSAWLLEEMNVVINRRTYTVDVTERLNMMLAAGDYPAVITNVPDAMANIFQSQDRAVNLEPFMEDFGYNITRRVGEYLDLLRHENGGLYKLPVNWGDNPNVAGWDFGIRYDLWRELDLPMFTTPEEYFYALLAVLEANPTNEFGERTFAVSTLGADATNQGLGLLTPMLAAYGFTGDRYLHNADGTFSHWLRTEEGRDVARLMNRMWRYGMVHPDYLSTTYDDYIAHLSNGRILGNLGTWWHAWVGGHEIWAVENPDWDNTQRFMNASVAWPSISMEETRLLTTNFIGAHRAVITDRADNVSEIMRFINWQSSELGNMINGWGPPTENNAWNIIDGQWILRDELMNIAQKNLYFHDMRARHGALLYNISAAGGWLRTDGRSNFDMLDPRVTRVSMWDYWPINPDDGSFADEGINIAWGNYTAQSFDATLYVVTFDPEEQVTWTRQTIIDNEPTWWALIMTASTEEEAMRHFDQAAAEAEALGIAELELFYQESFAANRALLGQ